MTIGALAIAVGVILLSGDRSNCTDCAKEETNVVEKNKNNEKPVKNVKENKKVENKINQISGYEGSDYASF